MMQRRTPPPPPGGYKTKTAEGLYRPRPQGKLEEALTESGKLHAVAPASPRPAEMLEGVVVDGHGKGSLTADDAALHELLVSAAYEADMRMPSDVVHVIPMAQVLHFLGENARRDAVKDSLKRLLSTTVSYGLAGGRRYEQVPLLTSWLESGDCEDVVKFSLPEPICALMRSQPRYAYVELAAISAMRCRYSSRLYRVLALEAAKAKWEPGGENKVVVSVTPGDLADWVGFPRRADGAVAYGKLKERLLSFLADGEDKEGDLSAVRKFSTEIKEHRKPGRGREVERIDFVLTLRPPSYKMVRVSFDPRHDIARVGGKDLPEYRVNGHVWRRVAIAFGERLGVEKHLAFQLWNVALNEALSGEALSNGYGSRRFRGDSLLDEMRVNGPDYAAWGFFVEEAESPDLATSGFPGRERAGELARHARIGFGKRRLAKTPAFIADDGKAEPVEVAKPELSFDKVGEIVLTADEAMSPDDLDSIIGVKVAAFRFTGSRPVRLTLRYTDRGRTDRWEMGTFPISEADLAGLQKELNRWLDGPEELLP
jgi:hypothetical protein